MSTPPLERSHALSRRHMLAAAMAGASAPVWSGFAGALDPAASAAGLPLVTPRSSQKAVESIGVCAMPTHDKTVYRYRSAWMANLADAGIRSIRGAYANGFAPTYETVSLARKHGMKWGMVVVPDLSMSDDKLRARIADIAKRAADVCLYIEGINEPNYSRSGARVSPTWKQQTLHKQQVLWAAVRSHASLRHVGVLGPSLQMQKATAADFDWFANNGLLQCMTYAGAHCYPAGYYPDHNFGDLLRPVTTHWHKPVVVTETGYTNAMANRGGQRPVPEDVAGVYAPSAVLEAVDRGWRLNFFEALDDQDAGAKDDVEANYGLWAMRAGTAPPWRAKPAASALKVLLRGMADPGPAYSPRPLGLHVSSAAGDVRWTALGKRDGSVRLYLRRSKPSYDPIHKVRLHVPAVPVRISSTRGNHSVSVGAKVVSVTL